MITFHNDHLVSPEFCKLLYDTIPEEYHIPVIFNPNTLDRHVAGECSYSSIALNLQIIYSDAYPGEYKLWKEMLTTAYQQFGYKATRNLTRNVYPEGYSAEKREHQYVKQLAKDWANQKLLDLAEKDNRLCQPRKLGPFFEYRIWRRKKSAKAFIRNRSWLIEEYRKYVTGGQLSASEMADMLGIYTYPKDRQHGNERIPVPDSRLINKLSKDLALVYCDHHDRQHLYFAWGDCLEIGRRVTRYKATHTPIPSEVEYLEQRKRYKTEEMSYLNADNNQDIMEFYPDGRVGTRPFAPTASVLLTGENRQYE